MPAWAHDALTLTRGHAVVALCVAVLIPLSSRAFGDGDFAYSMYARAGEYRISISSTDDAGRGHTVAPTDLARGARPSVVPLLAGADHWRTQPRVSELRSALPAVARRACAPAVVAVAITLEEREREGAEVRTTQARVACRP